MTTPLTLVTQAEIDELRRLHAESSTARDKWTGPSLPRGALIAIGEFNHAIDAALPRLLRTIEDLWASSRMGVEAYDDLRAQLQAVSAERDQAVAENARLRAEVERLRGVATEATNSLAEALQYVDMYFRDKWGLDDALGEYRAALAKEGEG